MLWNLTLTYLLFGIPYVNTTNMIIAAGPYVYNINLTSGAIVSKHFYMPYCGSSSCIPLCTNYVNGKILVGTSGALIAIKGGRFEVINYQPTFTCDDVLVHNIVYHDSFNAKMLTIIEEKGNSVTYDDCMCLGFVRGVASLMCKGGNFLKLGTKKIKIEAPALLSKPLDNLIAAVTANGKLYIINATSMRIVDSEKLDVLRISPSIPWPWRGGFLIPTPHTIYYWKGGELYYYRVRGTLLGVFANDDIILLATLSHNKLNITALPASSVKFHELSGGVVV